MCVLWERGCVYVNVRGCVYVCTHETECVCMGWLRSVGSINYRSLLQNIVSFIGLFCKIDL